MNILLKILFIYLRETERSQAGGGAEGEGEASSPLSKEPNLGLRGLIPGPWDHDLSQREVINWLSHPGVPWIACFLMLNDRSSLYILDINPLSHVRFANIFSHAVGCPFMLLMVSITVRKLLVWRYSISLFYLSLPLLLGSNPKNYCQDWCKGTYALVNCMISSLLNLRLILWPMDDI